MASIYYDKGKEEHVRMCIKRNDLVPPGQPFYCLSAEGLMNTHCCYQDYCNSIDLQVPGVATLGTTRASSAQERQSVNKLFLLVLPPSSKNGRRLDRNGEQLGSSGAGGGHRRARVSALCAADGRRVPVPVPPESLQSPTEAGGGGPLL